MPDSDFEFSRTDREILIGMRKDLKYVREGIDKDTARHARVLDDHEKRIRMLENFRWWLVGAIVASGALGAGIEKLIR